jgi:hypothetical protein
MRPYTLRVVLLASAVVVTLPLACSSSSNNAKSQPDSGTGSSGSGSGSSSGADSGSSSGAVTVICNCPSGATGSYCLSGQECDIYMYTGSEAQVSASAEQKTCSSEGATIVTSCPTAGLVGCCLINQGPSLNTNECMYTGTASVDEAMCTSNGDTWSTTPGGEETDGSASGGPDGSTGLGAWVGTWARTGTETVTCGSAAPTMDTLGGDVVIALGTSSGTITLKQSNGCTFVFTVSGDVASVVAGQTCTEAPNDAGVTNTITEGMHTLTLSADGTTITSVDSNTEQKSNSQTVCTVTATATLTM